MTSTSASKQGGTCVKARLPPHKALMAVIIERERENNFFFFAMTNTNRRRQRLKTPKQTDTEALRRPRINRTTKSKRYWTSRPKALIAYPYTLSYHHIFFKIALREHIHVWHLQHFR